MENKILIGDLSRYYNISKQTLIHYDRIGLLHPSAVDDNSYRYYTFQDVDRLDVILSLKDTGLSLKEIGNYLENPSLEDSIHLLKEQNGRLETHISKLQQTQRKLNYKISELEYIRQIEFTDEIQLLDKKDRYILYESLQKNLSDLERFPYAMKALNSRIHKSDYYLQYHHTIEGVIIESKVFDNADFLTISKIFIFIDQFNGFENESVLDGGLYVCKQHHGLYEDSYKSYEPMLKFIKDNQLEITGDAIEIPLITSWSVKTESEYITEIQIPVR